MNADRSPTYDSLEQMHDRVLREQAARHLVSVHQLAEAVRWAGEAVLHVHLPHVDLPLLQTRLDSLTAAERTYLEEISAARGRRALTAPPPPAR